MRGCQACCKARTDLLLGVEKGFYKSRQQVFTWRMVYTEIQGKRSGAVSTLSGADHELCCRADWRSRPSENGEEQ